MEVVYQPFPRRAGLDVHKKSPDSIGVITPEAQETRSFYTMTQDLLKLVLRLKDCSNTK